MPLLHLTEEQACEAGYPLTSKVWYNFKEEIDGAVTYSVGYIECLYFYFDPDKSKRELRFRIKTTSGAAEIVTEDRLRFGYVSLSGYFSSARPGFVGSEPIKLSSES